MAFNKERLSGIFGLCEVLAPLHEMNSTVGEGMKCHIAPLLSELHAVIIDFSHITYVNSSGLRILIQILKLLRDSDKELFLVEMSDEIYKIFTHTNLDKLFTFCASVDEAIKTLGSNDVL